MVFDPRQRGKEKNKIRFFIDAWSFDTNVKCMNHIERIYKGIIKREKKKNI